MVSNTPSSYFYKTSSFLFILIRQFKGLSICYLTLFYLCFETFLWCYNQIAHIISQVGTIMFYFVRFRITSNQIKHIISQVGSIMSYFARFRITSNQIEPYFASSFHCFLAMCMYIPEYSYVVECYIFDWFLQIKTIYSEEKEVIVTYVAARERFLQHHHAIVVSCFAKC